MLRFKGLLTASACLCLAGCVGDEFLVGGGGNDGAGGGTTGVTGPGSSGSTGTDAGSSSSSSSGSGGCAGCMADGACKTGDAVAECGAAGAACQVCTTDLLCQTPSCAGGACATVPANDGDPCPFVAGDETSGRCVTGQCLEAPEDCLNGVDDDEDGDPDCLDSDCDVAFTCVKDTPVPWTGPYAVYEGAVECPGVWGVVLGGTYGREPTAEPYTCECAATVTGCEEVSFTYATTLAGDATCEDAVGPTTIEVAAGACTPLGASTTAHFANEAAVGACEADVPDDFTYPTPTFSDVFTLCDAPVPAGGVGCDAGACRPRVPDSGGAQGEICILRSGDRVCDVPTFTAKRVVATGFGDTRGCDCTCDDVDCGAEVGFYDEMTCEQCNGADATCAALGLEESCASDLPAEAALFAGWVPDPAVVASGDPIGGVVESDLVTICCMQ